MNDFLLLEILKKLSKINYLKPFNRNLHYDEYFQG